jgi:hypothetical protein
MKRALLNIVIEAVSFVVFLSMISTGLLLKYVLPPGSGRVEMLFRGGRFEKSIDTFLGLTRHEWGGIHFYLALSFLILLIMHLALHWNWIKAMTFGTQERPQSLRRRTITVSVIVVAILILGFPWLFQKKAYTRSEFMEWRGIEGGVLKR